MRRSILLRNGLRQKLPTTLHPLSIPKTVMVGTNAIAFANIGDAQDYIDSFTIECWGAGAYREVKEAIAKESPTATSSCAFPTSGTLHRGTLTSFASTRRT